MQVSLILVSVICGIVSALQLGEWRWAVGALLMGANIPFTYIWIMPTNNMLKATDPGNADDATHSRLMSWGRLHAVRTLLGAMAVIAYAWAAH